MRCAEVETACAAGDSPPACGINRSGVAVQPVAIRPALILCGADRDA